MNPQLFSLCQLRLSLPLLLAGLLLPAAARAQVTYTGTAATQNFGSQPIGSPSSAKTFSFSLAAGTTVGSIAVVTQGAPNLDFTSATGGTCTAQTYASATTCTVKVTLNPKAAGSRVGAVIFLSGSGSTGTVLSEVLIRGVGTGPQIAYGPGVTIPLDQWNGLTNPAGLQFPSGIAVDAAGDVFVLDYDTSPKFSYRLVELPAGGGTPIVTDPEVGGDPLYLPGYVAVDGAGNLFIGDFYKRVVKVPFGGGAATAIAPTVNGIAMNTPQGLVVDGAGNLFISDLLNSRVLEVPFGGGAATAITPTVNGISLAHPYGLAADAVGDLFIVDGDRVLEVPASGGAATAVGTAANGTALSAPLGAAVDGVGDLFIADSNNYRVVEVPAGGGAPIAISPPQVEGQDVLPYNVAVDSVGNLLIRAEYDSGESDVVLETQHSQPPALAFPTVTNAGSTDTADGVQTAQILNIGNEALTLTALNYPTDFSESSGDANACAGSTSLSTGQECDVPVEFTPFHGGSLNEAVTLTDNALNVTAAHQTIAVSGTAVATAAIISPSVGSTLGASNVTFTWTSGYGVAYYELWLGIAGPGSSDLYSSGITTATSATVPILPVKGVTVYARLFSEINGVSQHTDYTYTEPTAVLATLNSPTPGTTLGASNVTFTWTAGSGIVNYNLWLGLSGPGSSSLYVSGITTATSVTVPTIPAKGQTVYVRLFSNAEGEWESRDYTYTEP